MSGISACFRCPLCEVSAMEMKYEDYGSLKPQNVFGTYPKYVCDQCVDYLELRDPDYVKAQLDKAGSLINWNTDVLMLGEAFDGSAFIAWGTFYGVQRISYISRDGSLTNSADGFHMPGYNFLMDTKRVREREKFLRICKEEPRNWLFIIGKESDGFWARGMTFAAWYTHDPRFAEMRAPAEDTDIPLPPALSSQMMRDYIQAVREQKKIPPWMRNTIVIDSMIAADTVKELYEPEKVLDVRIPKFDEMAGWTSEQRRAYSSYMMGHMSVKQLREAFQ